MAITWPDIPNTEDNALHTYFTEMQTILKKTIDSMTTTSKDDISSQISSSISSAIPKGIIVAWSGAIADIPSGWALCNGEHDTPDFRDKFIVAAGESYAVKATGGSSSSTVTGTVGGTAITAEQMPSHNHSFSWGSGGSATGGGYFYGGATAEKRQTGTNSAALSVGYSGSGATHTHSLTINSTSILPPYYALAWIMKL